MQDKDEPIKFYGPEKPYFELANFYPAPVKLDGKLWPTTEHYFQAQKTKDPRWKEKIRLAKTPDEAKKLAWKIPDYNDDNWLNKREEVMIKALRAKFTQHEKLQKVLIETGDRELIEDSPNDSYWGKVKGKGQNRIGALLMQVRADCGAGR